MGRLLPLVFCALSVLQLVGVAGAQETPACILQCSNQQRAEFGKFSCGSADDAACLCAKQDFSFGIRDCGASCQATDATVQQFLSTGFCQGHIAAVAPSAPAATSIPQPAPSPIPSSTLAHPAPTVSSTVSSSTTLSPQTTSSTSSSTSTAPSSSQESTTSTLSASASTIAGVASTSNAPQSAAPSSTLSGTPAEATTSAPAAAEPAGTGLSKAAVVGVGIGVGAAVCAVVGIAICLLLRNRKRKSTQTSELFKPLPGSGRLPGTSRVYGREHGSFEKNGNDIELSSNRYEDMVPRTQPRTMV
ncbi:hypothetical protein DCS_05050 [Drechmeria coniospora]|uniref:CFEM domain-containing protein n=1 Tax=Drechmeria coniospora TaxID=98403 RepID=A0A151GLQ8_DRECN|nr:hypothetical protein DCS_05050 [Drechmeria coniospora]KYK58037.1 hypothetical protein DCS_05050 [Drechmeria coniospora]